MRGPRCCRSQISSGSADGPDRSRPPEPGDRSSSILELGFPAEAVARRREIACRPPADQGESPHRDRERQRVEGGREERSSGWKGRKEQRGQENGVDCKKRPPAPEDEEQKTERDLPDPHKGQDRRLSARKGSQPPEDRDLARGWPQHFRN